MVATRGCLYFHRQTWKAWSVPFRANAFRVFTTFNHCSQAFSCCWSGYRSSLRSQSRSTHLTLGRPEARGRCTRTSSLLGDALRELVVFSPDAASRLRRITPSATACSQMFPRPRSMAGESLPPAERKDVSGSARQFWEGSQGAAYCALYHPFVVAVAVGNLQAGVYKEYIAQDYYFLRAFAEAYTIAIESTEDAGARKILTKLRSHVQVELDDVHFSSTGTEGQGLEVTKAEPNAATTAYTDFLLDVAKGKADVIGEIADLKPRSTGKIEGYASSKQVAAYTIAAMTPCNRLYAFLGREIKKSLNQETRSHPYTQWIEMYASEDFESTAVQCESLVDRLGAPLFDSGGEEIMRRLYRRAMDLEVAFFDAQLPPYSSGPLLVPVCHSLASKRHFVFVSDFDSTCSVSDSSPALADLSTSICEQSQLSSKTLKSRWEALVDEYSKGSGDLMTRILKPQTGNGFSPELVRRILGELSAFELEANDRVVNAGVLAGLKAADVERKGREMQLREGCKQLLERLSDCDVHILSVCWSRTFVEGAMAERSLKVSNIYCNELEFDSDGSSTGGMLRQVQTPIDKHRKFLNILKTGGNGSTSVFSVYVGDSVTDLLCLLTADIGFVICPSKSLARVAEACGITILPLHEGLVHKQRQKDQNSENGEYGDGIWNREDGVLYEISSWHEMYAFLLGIK